MPRDISLPSSCRPFSAWTASRPLKPSAAGPHRYLEPRQEFESPLRLWGKESYRHVRVTEIASVISTDIRNDGTSSHTDNLFCVLGVDSETSICSAKSHCNLLSPRRQLRQPLRRLRRSSRHRSRSTWGRATTSPTTAPLAVTVPDASMQQATQNRTTPKQCHDTTSKNNIITLDAHRRICRADHDGRGDPELDVDMGAQVNLFLYRGRCRSEPWAPGSYMSGNRSFVPRRLYSHLCSYHGGLN